MSSPVPEETDPEPIGFIKYEADTGCEIYLEEVTSDQEDVPMNKMPMYFMDPDGKFRPLKKHWETPQKKTSTPPSHYLRERSPPAVGPSTKERSSPEPAPAPTTSRSKEGFRVHPRVSREQLELLLRLLTSNREIAVALNRSIHSKALSKQKWKEMALALNAAPHGAYREWKEWSKYWVDYKAKLKKKVLTSFTAASDGAEGSTSEPLTEIELKFIKLLGKGFGKESPGPHISSTVASKESPAFRQLPTVTTKATPTSRPTSLREPSSPRTPSPTPTHESLLEVPITDPLQDSHHETYNQHSSSKYDPATSEHSSRLKRLGPLELRCRLKRPGSIENPTSMKRPGIVLEPLEHSANVDRSDFPGHSENLEQAAAPQRPGSCEHPATSTSDRVPSAESPPQSSGRGLASGRRRRRRDHPTPMSQEEARRALVQSAKLRADAAVRSSYALEGIQCTLQRIERLLYGAFSEAEE